MLFFPVKGAKSRSVLFLLGCFYKVFLNGSRTTSRQLNNRQKNYHSGQYSDRGMSRKHSGLKFGGGGGLHEFLATPITLKNELIAVTTTSIKNEIGRTPGERTLDRPCLTMVLHGFTRFLVMVYHLAVILPSLVI